MSEKASIPRLNYFVDDDGRLQAYVYTIGPGSDLHQHDDFFRESASFVMERGLQNKFGLMIADADESAQMWTEFEVPEKRGTLMIPQDIDLVVGSPLQLIVGTACSKL